MLLQYAWKGFWRRRMRSMLAVLGITLSVALFVAVATITQAVEQAIAASLDAAGADMVIQKRTEMCPWNIVKLPKDLARIDSEVVEKLAAHAGVEAAAGVLELWAFHQGQSPTPGVKFPKPQSTEAAAPAGDGAPGGLKPMMVTGIDPLMRTIGPVRIASREEVGEDESCCAVTSGRYLVRNDDQHVMLNQEYAEKKGFVVGDMIPMVPGIDYEVVALVDLSGAARISGAEAFVPLKSAQELLSQYAPQDQQGSFVDTIFVSLKTKRDLAIISKYAEELIGEGTSITTEANVDAGTAALASVTRNSLLAISGFVLIFALLILVRNALDSVAQRVDEIGVMKAIGWRNADVGRLFVAEAAYVGVIGGVVGSAIGSAIGWIYGNTANLKLPSSLASWAPCSETDPPLALPLSTDPSLWIFVVGLGLALLIGTISGLAASRRAAQLDPVDALRRL